VKLIPVLLSFVFGASAFAAEGDGSLPLNPKPGQCYIHKFYPPTWEQGEISVVIKEGYRRFAVTPAVFRNETVNVTVRDGVDEIRVSQATFKNVTEKIEIQPAESFWKVDCCPAKPHHYKGSDADWRKSCEQACFKSHPPVFKTITKQVIDKEPTATTTSLPPEVQQIIVRRLVTGPKLLTTEIPPEFMKFKTKKLIQPGYMKWEEGTCGKYTCDPRELKSSLKAKGYYAGPMTPEITPDVVAAMNKFRADNGLGQHDELDEQTASALGITGYTKN